VDWEERQEVLLHHLKQGTERGEVGFGGYKQPSSPSKRSLPFMVWAVGWLVLVHIIDTFHCTYH
jgi:hypothetical protein